jgi:hypothetical protein
MISCRFSAPDHPVKLLPFVVARKAGTILSARLLLVPFLVQGILFICANSLVTTDVGVTLWIFLVLYLLREYVNSPNWT